MLFKSLAIFKQYVLKINAGYKSRGRKLSPRFLRGKAFHVPSECVVEHAKNILVENRSETLRADCRA